MNTAYTTLIWMLFSQVTVAQNPSTQSRLENAIDRATVVLEKGVKNYPEHRSCFSCHHQALPLFAFSVGKLHSDNQASFHGNESTQQILEFTTAAFENKIQSLNSGAEIGGRALTVAYGLWALDLAGAKSSEVSQAMIENLLQTQDKEGAWNFQSARPPAASSRLMTSAVAIYGLRSYTDDSKMDRIHAAFDRAFEWSKSQNAESHEDLIGQIWLESMIVEEQGSRDITRLDQLGHKLLESQKPDGGWSQTLEMKSDPYATGQAVIMLSHLTNLRTQFKEEVRSSKDQAVKFLLDSQQPDGSWHVASRSKPVQVFFDNGDPHGKDQFISTMATSWATAALREIKYKSGKPLISTRVAQRLGGSPSN